MGNALNPHQLLGYFITTTSVDGERADAASRRSVSWTGSQTVRF